MGGHSTYGVCFVDTSIGTFYVRRCFVFCQSHFRCITGQLSNVSKSIECDIIPFSALIWHCWLGGRKGIWPVKSWTLVCWWWFDWIFAWLMWPVVTTTSIILCFSKHQLTQVHLENGRLNAEREREREREREWRQSCFVPVRSSVCFFVHARDNWRCHLFIRTKFSALIECTWAKSVRCHYSAFGEETWMDQILDPYVQWIHITGKLK